MFEDDEEELSCDEENDDGFEEDMEALRRACTLAGANLNDIKDTYEGGTNVYSSSVEVEEEEEEEEADRDSTGDEDDDLELFRRVQSRFSKSNDSLEPPLSLKALSSIHHDFDDEDDDFETLCAVRRRFSTYDASDETRRTTEKTLAENKEGAELENAVSEGAESTGRKNCKVFPDIEDTSNLLNDNMDIVPPSSIEQHQLDTFKLSSLGMRSFSSFPKSAQLFIDAIKRNRSCQKFLQSKLVQIEARMEENKKLKERVKILKDFQGKCRIIIGRALGQGKHPHVRLISARKAANSGDTEVNGKKASAMCYGPVENSHVANYREALGNFPLVLKEKKWTEADKENLKKGIRQQLQEKVLHHYSVDQFSGSDGSPRYTNNLDAIIASIRDLEITPEMCREFLPKVNWDQVASLYVAGHTGAQCELRWLNFEDPLINHSEWTIAEDKKLLFIVQEKGMTNWFDIAVLHGKNRTPFQCLARFQRSLNAHIIRREWTKEEDAQLRIAVETYGENDWQSVASALEGRTGPQCSNRWNKSIHPDISRVGRWTPEESKRLKVAVMLFGPKNWRNIAQFVPGRTHVKCRERWFNCVDPSLKKDKWTEDEDSRLEAAIQEHGYCWAKIAKCLAPRTDSQCLRRWKILFPHEVPLLQGVRRTQKAAIISNFVDRESQRPTLGPHDFVPRLSIRSASEAENINQSEAENINQSRKRKRQTRKVISSEKDKNDVPGNFPKRPRSKRLKEGVQISSLQDTGKTSVAEAGDSGGNAAAVTKRRRKPRSGKNSPAEHNQDDSLPDLLLTNRTDSIIVYTRRKKKLPVDPERNGLIENEADGNSQIQPKLHPVATESADDHLHSNILAGDDGGHGTANQFNASCKITKRRLNGKVHKESADNVKGLMMPVGISEQTASTIEYDNSSVNVITSCKVNKAPKSSRRRSSKPSAESQGVDLVCNKRENKKSKVRSKSRSNQVSDPNDDSDVTLSRYISQKRRRRQVPENADELSNMNMRFEGNEVENNNEIAENVISCATDDMHNTGSVEDMVLVDSRTDEQMIHREGENHDVDLDLDITLARFLHKQQRKRDKVPPRKTKP